MDQLLLIEKGFIIEGEGRYLAQKDMGLKEIEVIKLTHLSEEQKVAYMLVHNKLTMNTGFDIDILEEELAKISNIDMQEFEFDIKQLEEELENEVNTSSESSFNYKEQYGVIVICKNEEDQEKVYNKLLDQGYECNGGDNIMDNKTKIEIHNRVQDFNSYRAARVKSLFNAENGCNFDLEAEIDLSGEWQIGVVVGPSGSGKSSIGKVIFGENLIYDYTKGWATDRPIIDEIAPNGDFNEVTGALANVGLGDVPAWLRPFRVLSNGEQFRAGLARLICEKPEKVVIDEFTSVIDRQIAKIGSQAFQKAWRRTNPNGKVVLLTPHYDILDWVKPDWVFDTKTKVFERGLARQRPKIDLQFSMSTKVTGNILSHIII